MKTNTILALLSITALAALTGCGGSGDKEAAMSPEQAQLDRFFLESKPAEPISVAQMVANPVEDGTDVTVIGKIGGAVDPFGNNFAVFFLADEGIYFCDEMPEDSCPTPWDACCEDPDKLAKSRILVQLTDESGEPLEFSLLGVNGLSGLDTIVVRGTAVGASEGAPTIHADGIFIQKDEIL